ncbi:MAG TPA: pyridoxamine 5'-phosphate oxidase family protein [Longimicrobium sp.]|nr:pyridoxamine 5'-phosphate oxidase family protein [Longimicrobium sp.]
MASPYHPGEIAVQTRAGVLTAALRLGGIIAPQLPPRAGQFLATQRLAVLGATGAEGRVWASALAGEPGFLRMVDETILHIAATPAAGDPLAAVFAHAAALAEPLDVGVLVIDPATRRRLRVNGLAWPAPGGGVRVNVRQAYWNCPKYIQQRTPAPRPSLPAAAMESGEPRRGASLSDRQRGWVASADTFFIATAHPAGGTDASHRGGEPGFVRLERGVEGQDVLVFPDYPGNNMFNTLGNLAENPAAGLLFLDFERGATLQLTGTAQVLWERGEYADFPGAERAVRFRVAEVVELPHDTTPRWHLEDRSPFNPPPPAP